MFDGMFDGIDGMFDGMFDRMFDAHPVGCTLLLDFFANTHNRRTDRRADGDADGQAGDLALLDAVLTAARRAVAPLSSWSTIQF